MPLPRSPSQPSEGAHADQERPSVDQPPAERGASLEGRILESQIVVPPADHEQPEQDSKEQINLDF